MQRQASDVSALLPSPVSWSRALAKPSGLLGSSQAGNGFAPNLREPASPLHVSRRSSIKVVVYVSSADVEAASFSAGSCTASLTSAQRPACTAQDICGGADAQLAAPHVLQRDVVRHAPTRHCRGSALQICDMLPSCNGALHARCQTPKLKHSDAAVHCGGAQASSRRRRKRRTSMRHPTALTPSAPASSNGSKPVALLARPPAVACRELGDRWAALQLLHR